VTGFLWIVLGLIALGLVLHLVAWLVQVPVATRVFGDMPWLPAESCGPLDGGEPVEFTTRDGVRLSGSYLSAPLGRRRGVIAFCHELNGDRWSALPYTRELLRRGFDILTFDFRNHGESGRIAGYEPMPWVTTYEVNDVRAAVDYLASRESVKTLPIGLLGISRGGTAALCAAGRDGRVSAIVIDGPVPAEQMQVHYTRRVLRDFLWPSSLANLVPTVCLGLLGTWAKLVIAWRCRCRMASVDQAARRNRRPVLLIHAGDDPCVPLEAVQGLRAEMRKHARLWIVPRARHCRSIVASPEQYHHRLIRFFGAHMGSPEPVPVLTGIHAPVRSADLPSPVLLPFTRNHPR
jgi:pimeloyl-ACP methyl ester carboxylesterase